MKGNSSDLVEPFVISSIEDEIILDNSHDYTSGDDDGRDSDDDDDGDGRNYDEESPKLDGYILDKEADRLCIGSKDFDMYSPIYSGGSSSLCDSTDLVGSHGVDSGKETKRNGHFPQDPAADDIVPSVSPNDRDRKRGQCSPLLGPVPPQVSLHPSHQSLSSSTDSYGYEYEAGQLTQAEPQKTKKWRFLTNDELPSLNIVIMVVGTHGDVLPFVGFAHSLQAIGHRVRIASHECHRGLVVSRNIEFYPLAGNPKILSEFMVRTGGSLYGSAKNPSFFASNTRMVKEIIKSTWKACTEVDPDDPEETPFVVDAIVSNPATMGHIHVAEALGVPLHIMFPQPWYYGTRVIV